MPPSNKSVANPADARGDDLLIVVDAGGTKTAAWIVDLARSEGDQLIGAGRAAAANPFSVGFEQATNALGEAITAAKANAGLANSRVARAILSIAGSANDQIVSDFVKWSRKCSVAGNIAIVPDVMPMLAAGAPDCCGVALISGTGSVAFGRRADGKSLLCGGWGYLLGDEGSGYTIGREALRFSLLDLEVDRPEPLTHLVLSALNAKDTMDIKRAVYANGNSRSEIAALAPVVIDAAAAGDHRAMEILNEAAWDLAELVRRAVGILQLDARPLPLAIGGGVLVASQHLRDQLQQELQQVGIECASVTVTEPLRGCVHLASPQFDGTLITWHTV